MRYFLGFLAAIGLVVIVFILIFRGLSGDRDAPKDQAVLTDYARTNTITRLTLDGPIIADQVHQAVRISVGRNQNKIELIQGYQNQVVQEKTYPNNEDAYHVFLRALQLLGYTKGSDDPARADERGQCPTGQRYVFEVINDSSSVQRFWSTSCGGGTFGGNTNAVRDLYRKQIPDYTQITRGWKVY
ncbi:MAG TPA: hypothetical protein VJ836_00220 [Candidatus Saccharimonadales bacterium]|nr:hypothetical protein [Candidatus Saccharimonadales bacterium]